MHRLARPPDAAIEWAGEVVGSRVARVKPLTGGMSTGIHLLTTDSRARVVMRRFVNQEWLAIDPHLAPREAAVLQALEATPVPAPAFVGVDPYGERCGAPTVLMGFVPGRRKPPGELRRWAAELARAMATIHDVTPPAVDGLPDELARLARTIGEGTTNRHGSVRGLDRELRRDGLCRPHGRHRADAVRGVRRRRAAQPAVTGGVSSGSNASRAVVSRAWTATPTSPR